MVVSLDDIRRARDSIAGKVHRTPVIRSDYLGAQVGANVALKLENTQKTGAFKVRGAFNKLHNLSDAEKARGVIAVSSGNHGQALAYGGGQLGIPVTVVMPTWSTPSKVEQTTGYGAEVVITEGDMIEEADRIRGERGMTMIHPFDDLHIIAGAGTIGLEIFQDLPEADMVVCGIGGGGLISGVAAAVKLSKPQARVIGVEPEGAPTMTESLRLGEPSRLDSVNTVADGLASPWGGVHTLAHAQEYVDDVVLVSDAEIIDAINVTVERCKIVIEPAAASTVAALLSGRLDVTPDSTVVCVVSGGNVDPGRLVDYLSKDR